MYLTEFTAQGIKCFADLRLRFADSEDRGYAGWNVILGANATGKTTLLQAIAATLVGPAAANRLVSPMGWLRLGTAQGELGVRFLQGNQDAAEGAPRKKPYEASFTVVGTQPVKVGEQEYTAPQIVLTTKAPGLIRGPYAAAKSGWLICGYGSFRRFTGGAEDDLTHEQGRVGRVASLFRESVALKRGLDWLPQLYAASLDARHSGNLLELMEYQTVRDLLDQILPPMVQIADVDTRRVYFRAPGAERVGLLDLSDGYRSFLALVVDLLRQMAEVFGSVWPLVTTHSDNSLTVEADGVVLIDEIDAHLHPTWQREIGQRLQKIFPRLQFIVTSHSPFIAQAARPDGLFVLRAGESGEPATLLRTPGRYDGWTADQLLQSPLFGVSDTHDLETERLLKEHAALRGTERFGTPTAEERHRLTAIEQVLTERLTAPGELSKQGVDDLVALAATKLRTHKGG